MTEASDYRITSVVFGERWLEISFYESRDESPDVIDVKQRLIKPSLFPEALERVLEDLTEILDGAAVHRRNPATQFRRVNDES